MLPEKDLGSTRVGLGSLLKWPLMPEETEPNKAALYVGFDPGASQALLSLLVLVLSPVGELSACRALDVPGIYLEEGPTSPARGISQEPPEATMTAGGGRRTVEVGIWQISANVAGRGVDADGWGPRAWGVSSARDGDVEYISLADAAAAIDTPMVEVALGAGDGCERLLIPRSVGPDGTKCSRN